MKYGVADNQITTAGDGKRAPEVDNRTKEGRFMNRRVVMTLTDGTGHVIKEGGVGDVISAITDKLDNLLKKQQECCDQILKKLDKLDDILAQLKNLQGENDKLRGEVGDLRNQQNALKDQVNAMPKPLTASQTQDIAHTEATGAVDEAQRRNKKFSIVGVNIGPTIGAGRTGDFNFNGRAAFFSPFGGDGTRAVQAQGEYSYYSGRQEGQFDLGIVNRWGNLQAGAFGSFKYLNFKGFQSAGGLGQASFLFDYIFGRGRLGLYGTQGFKNIAVLNSVQLGPQSFTQTYRASREPVRRERAGGRLGQCVCARQHRLPAASWPGQRRSGRGLEAGSAVERARRVHGGSRFERDFSQHKRQRTHRLRVRGRQLHPPEGIRQDQDPGADGHSADPVRTADAACRQLAPGGQCRTGPDWSCRAER